MAAALSLRASSLSGRLAVPPPDATRDWRERRDPPDFTQGDERPLHRNIDAGDDATPEKFGRFDCRSERVRRAFGAFFSPVHTSLMALLL